MSKGDGKGAYVVIMASAGSGKTYTLTLQYIRILRRALQTGQEQAVERILATTFTRAAAGEIIDRVLHTLAEAVLSEKERSKLSDALGERLPQDEAARLLEAVVRHLHRLRICTLDAFLVRAAVAFAPELGLPGAWRIADASEDQSLRLEAIERVLEAHVEERDTREQMLDLLIKLHQGKFPREIAPTLADEFSGTYTAFLGAAKSAWEAITPKCAALSRDALKSCLEDLARKLPALVPTTKKGDPNKRWAGWVDSLMASAREGDWPRLASADALAALVLGQEAKFSGVVMPDAFAEAIRPLVEHTVACVISTLREQNLSLCHLLTHFHEIYARLKDLRGAYQFDDFTFKLLDADVLENRDTFFFRLDGQIDHILLDEFQDTSVPQWKLLEPLVEEIVSGEGRDDGRSLLCVGDVKQTLYAWRNAEPRLFGELLRKWPQIHRDSLLKSYRSVGVIIDTVNTIFGDMPANPALVPADDEHAYVAAAARVWAGWFEPHTTKFEKEPGFARLRTCAEGDSPAETQIAAVESAARLVAERLAVSPGDEIAVLFRKKQHIPRLIELLRRRNIFAAGEGGSPLTDDPAVCGALSALHLLDHPGDTAAVYHVATSPLGPALEITDGLSGESLSMKLRAIRQQIADVGFGGTLSEWLEQISPACDARNQRRFSQLVAAAHAFGGDTDAGSFIRAVREMRVEDAAAARVRVMTIHASKGRQFDTVILPDLDAKFGSQPPRLLTRRPHLLEDFDCITRAAPRSILRLDPLLWEIYQSSMQQDVVEELCGLYVAMTRAKSGLEMIVHPQKPRKDGDAKLPVSMAGILRGVLVPGENTAEPDKMLWECSRCKIPVKDLETTQAPRGEVPVHVLRPLSGTLRVRPTIAPSSLEGGGHTRLDGKLTFGDSGALDRGTLTHKFFELVDFLDGPLPAEAALREAARDAGLSAAEVEGSIREFLAWCRQPNLRKVLARPAGDIELWRERPFAIRQPHPRGFDVTLQGQFDRVVINRKNGVAVAADLIDFKTDSVPDRATLADRVAHYTPQLHAYKRALAAMLGLPDGAVGATLFLLRADHAVRL